MYDTGLDENLKKYNKWHKINVIASACNGVLFLIYAVYKTIKEFAAMEIPAVFDKAFSFTLIGLWAPVLIMILISAIKAHKYGARLPDEDAT